RDTIQEALESLETFKGQHLKNRSQGIITLFKDINSIAGKNSVKLTSGISMRDETIGAGGQSGPGSRDSRSLLDQFSSVKMDFTVAGQYQNLRDFISDLERNKQFIIIDSIQLLSVDDIGGGGGGRRAQSAGIALSIGLTAYFQN
ncbi:MAG TPA: GspMb/PilO family protein, partial [Blastocatellia bacterium]|nr:GspMb/PilO family protein [Blastocatellia bacterium]